MPLSATQAQLVPSTSNNKCSSGSKLGAVKEKKWSNRTLTTTGLAIGGVAIATGLNYFAPSSLRQTVFRYAVCQVPAVLYYLATTKTSPALLRTINQKLESTVRKEAGIPKEAKICAAKCVTWLNDLQEFPLFDSSKLKEAYQSIYGDPKSDFTCAIDFLKAKGWQCTEHFTNQTHLSGGMFSFVEKPPLESLNIYDALLCFMIPKEHETGIPHMCVLVKKSETEFIIYDPNLFIPFIKNTHRECIEELFKLAEDNGKEFYLYTKAKPFNFIKPVELSANEG